MNAPVHRFSASRFAFLATALFLAGPFDARALPPGQREPLRQCSGESCPAQVETEVVALALPMSGVHSAIGGSVGQALERALGVVTGIKLVTFDTAGTVAGAERAVSDAVKAGAALIVGGIGDKESAAMSAAAARAGIPLVTMGRSAMPGNTTIQAVASRQALAGALLDEMVGQGPVDCAWVIYMDNPFGEAELAAFRRSLDKRGIRLAGSTRMHAEGGDEVGYAAAITGQIASLRESGSCVNELLHLVLDVDDAGRLVDHLWYSGFFDKAAGSIRMTGTGLMNAPGLAAQHGSSLKGLVFVDIEPVSGEVSTRADLFNLEVEDFAAVAAGTARALAGGASPDQAAIPPETAGRTGSLVYRDGAMVGQRIRAWKMTGRGLDFVTEVAGPGQAVPGTDSLEGAGAESGPVLP